VVASLMEVYGSPDNYRGNAGWPRTGKSDLNIAVVQQAISQSPLKSITRCSLETDSAKNSVANLDTGPRDATVPHSSRPSFDSGAKACSHGMLPDFSRNDEYPTRHCESDGIQQ